MAEKNRGLNHIEELDSRVTFQEDAIEKLNDVIVRQDQEIVQLQAAVKRLERLVQDLTDGMSLDAGGDEAPPHY